MKKRNVVFFVLSVLFFVIAVLLAVFSLHFFAAFCSVGGTAQDLGEAIGGAAAATVIAIFWVFFSIGCWIFSGLAALFAALNLRASVKWMRICAIILPAIAFLLAVTTAIPFFLRAV